MKLQKKKAISLLAHISEGCGVRKTGRLVGVNRNAVMGYSRLAGKHATMVIGAILSLPHIGLRQAPP
jgi:hypothetical protein